MTETMPRCRDCRWWMQREIPPEHQRSDDVALGRQWGICQVTASHQNVPVVTETMAFASNDGYELELDQDGAVLVTAPDFGCVQWEANSDD